MLEIEDGLTTAYIFIVGFIMGTLVQCTAEFILFRHAERAFKGAIKR